MSGENLSSSSSAVAASYRYYAPLPLRVVNEDYALIAGFLGGIVVFALYLAVLIGLRCVQHAQTAQRARQSRRCSIAFPPPPPPPPSNNVSQQDDSVPSYGAWVWKAERQPQRSAQTTTATAALINDDGPRYERGVLSRPAAGPPQPPPRR